MSILQRVIYLVDHISEWSGRIFSFSVAFLMFFVVFEVIMRYMFNKPTDWSMESSQMLMLLMISMGTGYTLLHDGHVKVTILRERLPIKTGAILDVFTDLIVIVVSIVLIWYGWKVFWQSYTFGFRTASSWAPLLWPAKLLVPLSGLALGIQCISKILRNFIFVLLGHQVASAQLAENIKNH
jgi:TRAP-type mannitol/chloroaromatic compound transport system permease small subunit